MKLLKPTILLLLFFLVAINTTNAQDTATVLDSVIKKYEQHQGYDRKAYPLGLFTKAYFKAEAEFAESILDELRTIDTSGLSETEQISAELLAFVLQDKIDYYTF